MVFEPGLAIGDVIQNERLCKIFMCSSQGGMRRSLRTNTLVLTSGISPNSPYADRWAEGCIHYTGMGQTGDQRLDWAQNKTLADSQTNGVRVFLFDKDGLDYIYRGEVELAARLYRELQAGADGVMRQAWVFPLRVVAGQHGPVPAVMKAGGPQEADVFGDPTICIEGLTRAELERLEEALEGLATVKAEPVRKRRDTRAGEVSLVVGAVPNLLQWTATIVTLAPAVGAVAKAIEAQRKRHWLISGNVPELTPGYARLRKP